MRSKSKKLSVTKKKTGSFQYQNLWHLPKLTKKQEKYLKFHKKVRSTEQRTKVTKFHVQKAISPNQRNYWQRSFKNPSKFLRRKQTSMNKSLKKYKTLKENRMWFFDTAAPIPGISFLKKQKKFYRRKQNAYKNLQRFLCIFNKKQRKNLFRAVNKQKKTQFLPKNWAALMQIESLYQTSLRKTALLQKPQEKNLLMFSFLNGKSVQKKGFVLSKSKKTEQKPRDFCSIPNIQKGMKKLQTFYASLNSSKELFFSF